MTSSDQLEAALRRPAYAAKARQNGFLGVFSADEVLRLAVPPPRPGGWSLIANYSPLSDERGGTHWIAMSRLNDSNGRPPFFFDSYGTAPDNDDSILHLGTDFRPFLRAHNRSRKKLPGWEHNPYDLQAYSGPNNNTCGEWSVFFIANGPPVMGNDGRFAGAWAPFQNTDLVANAFSPTLQTAFARRPKNVAAAQRNDALIRRMVGVVPVAKGRSL
eukprot:m.314591 g.314591  ORF g.314591 m.314591 type:complete len:216 (+) comp23063_c0_seq12:3032-3679(+)